MITTISENSNRVAVVLERHETRLDEGDKSNQLIIRMIEEMKDQEEKNHKILHERIDRIQKKVDSNQKFVIGVTAVLTTLVAVLQVVPPIIRSLDSYSNSSMMGSGIVGSLNESSRRSVYQRISCLLENFSSKRNNLYNFRCPYCGDSQKNKNKARGFLYQVKSDTAYKCHNCGKSTTFTRFLKILIQIS